MTKRAASLLIGLSLLAVATSASAECARVLWSRFVAGNQRATDVDWTKGGSGGEAYATRAECEDRIASVTHLVRPRSIGDWLEWLQSAGSYDPKRSLASKDFTGSQWLSGGGAITVTLFRFILLGVFTAMAAVCDRLIGIAVVVGSLLAIDILLFNTGVVFVSARPLNLLRSNLFTAFGYVSLALAFSPFWLWLHCSGGSAIARFLDAIYQSVRTLTTAGPEGPLSSGAKALASVESLFGIYFLSIIIAGYLALPKGGRTA